MHPPFRALTAVFLCLAPGPAAADLTDTNWIDVGGALSGGSGDPVLAGSGEVEPGALVSLDVTNAAPSSPAWLVAGKQNLGLPFLGGTLVPSPDFVAGPFSTDASGSLALSQVWPLGPPVGLDYWFQVWIADPVTHASATNGLQAQPVATPPSGTFPATWISGGPDCGTEPDIQVHKYNDDLYILRQSLCVSFEGPFMYLIFGADRALLIDTGDGVNLAPTINQLVGDWTTAHGITDYELIVAHSHAHGDHTAGDSQFVGQPNTTVVGTSPGAVQAFFGISSWPEEIVAFDLGGGRVLDIVPIPGHEPSHVAYYDRETAVLITGDHLYPGRCYIFGAETAGQWPVYQASCQRLVDFTKDKDICWVLGTHIEMTSTPGVDFPFGSTHHLNEHVLELERKHLMELNVAVQLMGDDPHFDVHDDFIIVPLF